MSNLLNLIRFAEITKTRLVIASLAATASVTSLSWSIAGHSGRLLAQDRLEMNVAELEEVQMLAGRYLAASAVRSGRRADAPPSGISLLEVVSSTANSRELTIANVDVAANETQLYVDLESVRFTTLVEWLNQLSIEYDILIGNTTISNTPAPARVNVQVSFHLARE